MSNFPGLIFGIPKVMGTLFDGSNSVNEITSKQRDVETASEKKNETGANLADKKDALSQATEFLNGAIDAVDVAKEALESVLDMISDLIGGLFGGGDDGSAEKEEAERNLKEAQATQAEAEQTQNKAKTDKDAAQQEDVSAKDNEGKAKTDLDKAKEKREKEIKQEYDELNTKLPTLKEGTQEYAVTANRMKALYWELQNLSQIGTTNEVGVSSPQVEDEIQQPITGRFFYAES